MCGVFTSDCISPTAACSSIVCLFVCLLLLLSLSSPRRAPTTTLTPSSTAKCFVCPPLLFTHLSPADISHRDAATPLPQQPPSAATAMLPPDGVDGKCKLKCRSFARGGGRRHGAVREAPNAALMRLEQGRLGWATKEPSLFFVKRLQVNGSVLLLAPLLSKVPY